MLCEISLQGLQMIELSIGDSLRVVTTFGYRGTDPERSIGFWLETILLKPVSPILPMAAYRVSCCLATCMKDKLLIR